MRVPQIAKTPTIMQSDNYPNAGLLRRFAAMLYDAFLVVALWMISTTLFVALLTDGAEAQGLWFQLFLYAELAAFYIFFWHLKGQTLGMQVWKIRVLTRDGETPGYRQCLIRFAMATVSTLAFGLGFIWMYFNKERLTLHDIVSGSHVAYLGTNPYKSEQD
jgi:uncharacterized RDD family membrane protein YckC